MAFEEAYLCVGGKQRELEFEGGEYTNSKSQLGWDLWQIKAKVQEVALPETRAVTLTCAELKDAFDFGAPDGEKDQFQMETEMTIKWLQDGYDGEGYYCWYADLPEEGCIKLGVSESGAEG
ncbi:hypothetical protein P640_2472 [Acinetobacter baumannii UH0707]|nr:hypothetical protein C7R87_1757 [Acinetobacter baumannii]ETP80045.1 hypothetical protein P640_2472 [Acinetobacter baumannii UH0707]ETP84139.1 hypothetical protein P641_1351 [Acinetobacter baumannii UH0807]ETP95306.1 hypothetical protein P645_3832 [Acinetobacter baumannii UH10707]ETQ71145.1 hypothetical protein P665_2667 [Acinetobacter baumannii UH2907]ETQ71892.1 hypothetical protein P664_2972 [Acinetobacter baumannii UH2707]ETR25511.1 hypothetical protein P677_2567 [Acinetobacter baumannii